LHWDRDPTTIYPIGNRPIRKYQTVIGNTYESDLSRVSDVTLIISELIRYCFEIENFRVKFIELNRKIKKEPGKRINLEIDECKKYFSA